MEFVILGLAVYYVTMILLFDIEEIGIFPSEKSYVKTIDHEHVFSKPVDLFDRFRYLFGAYRIEKDSEGRFVWFVRPYTMLVWVCPACLGFWVAIIIFLINFFVPQQYPLIQVLALAGFVRFLSVWKS